MDIKKSPKLYALPSLSLPSNDSKCLQTQWPPRLWCVSQVQLQAPLEDRRRETEKEQVSREEEV